MAHAEEYAQEARVVKVERGARDEQATDGAPARRQASSGWDLKRALKMAACCGLPLLAVVFLAGGGGALLGAGAAVLPLLAVLACPLGMFFMMRALQSHGKGDGHTVSDRPPTTRETEKR